MIIESSDGRKTIDVGSDDLWNSVISTVLVRLDHKLTEFPLGVQFLKTAKCSSKDALITARDINLIRDKLAQIPPQEAVYDYNNLQLQAPWDGNISPVVTSCANLYTTADGGDLLFELTSILCYAAYKKVDVQPFN